MKKLIALIIVLTSMMTGTILVDGIHGFTDQFGVSLESLLPQHEFEYFTPEDFPIQDTYLLATVTEFTSEFTFTVPAGIPVLYLRYQMIPGETMQHPFFLLQDPADQYHTGAFMGQMVIENPVSGTWFMTVENWEAEQVDIEIGSGPHYYTADLLSEYDAVMQIIENTFSLFVGYTPMHTASEMQVLEEYLENGGGYMLLRESDNTMVDKPVIRLYSDTQITAEVQLRFPGMPTFSDPPVDANHRNGRYVMSWANQDIHPGTFTEILYEGRPVSALHFLTAEKSGTGFSVTNHGSFQLHGIHLLKQTGSGFEYAHIDQLSGSESGFADVQSFFTASELDDHLHRQLTNEGIQGGLKATDVQDFFMRYPWIHRWVGMAERAGEICAVYHFSGSDYNSFIPFDMDPAPETVERLMWVFSENLPEQLLGSPIHLTVGDTGHPDTESTPGLEYYEYGVIEERYPGTQDGTRQLNFMGADYADCIIVDNTDNYQGDPWSPVFYTPGENDIADLLTAGVDQVYASMASPIVLFDPQTQFPVLTGDEDTYCEYEPMFPAGSYPIVVQAQQVDQGKLLAINDRQILSSNLDNLLFVSNCFDWLLQPSTEQGDVNADGNLDVLDIVLMVNFIVGITIPDNYEFWASDINADGELNVLDVVQLVNIIVNPPQLPEECLLLPEVGPCDGLCPRFYFNQDTGNCEMFYWGCCDGVVPFETMEECEAACEQP